MPPRDWYCDEVIPGRSDVEVLVDVPEVLAFRPDRPGFGIEHIIVVPKQHIPSLVDLDAGAAGQLFLIVQQMARLVCADIGGCQIIVSVGSEQHNQHLHVHVAAGDGVARFVSIGIDRADPELS